MSPIRVLVRCVLVPIVSVPLVVPTAAAAQGDDPAEVTAKERDAAIRKGFDFVDERVWRMNDHGSPQKQYTLGVTAWASLLATDKVGGAKKLPSRSKQLDRIRGYLERYVEQVAREYERDDEKNRRKKKDDPPAGGFGFGDMMKPSQYIWPLSMTTHFFAESMARGRSKSPSKKFLKEIVTVLEASQQESGGWGHDDAAREGMGLPPIQIPKPGGGTSGYPPTLLAASHCALSSLGVAHTLLKVKDDEPLKDGIRYFVESQSASGSFPYDPTQKHDFQTGGAAMFELDIARTPGAFLALCCAGASMQDEVVRKAAKAMDASPKSWSEGHGSATMALQFAALAARARGQEAWQIFRDEFFRTILDHQAEDGSYDCIARGESFGVTNDTEPLPGLGGMGDWTASQRVYVTAIHTMILLLDRCELKAMPEIEFPVSQATTGGED